MNFQELLDAQLSRSKFKITPQGWKLLSLLLVKPMMSYELAGIVLWPNAKIRDIKHIHVFMSNLGKRILVNFQDISINSIRNEGYYISSEDQTTIISAIKEIEIHEEIEIPLILNNTYYLIATIKGDFIGQTNPRLAKNKVAPHMWGNYFKAARWLEKHKGNFHEKLYLKKITLTTQFMDAQPVERKGEND